MAGWYVYLDGTEYSFDDLDKLNNVDRNVLKVKLMRGFANLFDVYRGKFPFLDRTPISVHFDTSQRSPACTYLTKGFDGVPKIVIVINPHKVVELAKKCGFSGDLTNFVVELFLHELQHIVLGDLDYVRSKLVPDIELLNIISDAFINETVIEIMKRANQTSFLDKMRDKIVTMKALYDYIEKMYKKLDMLINAVKNRQVTLKNPQDYDKMINVRKMLEEVAEKIRDVKEGDIRKKLLSIREIYLIMLKVKDFIKQMSEMFKDVENGGGTGDNAGDNSGEGIGDDFGYSGEGSGYEGEGSEIGGGDEKSKEGRKGSKGTIDVNKIAKEIEKAYKDLKKKGNMLGDPEKDISDLQASHENIENAVNSGKFGENDVEKALKDVRTTVSQAYERYRKYKSSWQNIPQEVDEIMADIARLASSGDADEVVKRMKDLSKILFNVTDRVIAIVSEKNVDDSLYLERQPVKAYMHPRLAMDYNAYVKVRKWKEVPVSSPRAFVGYISIDSSGSISDSELHIYSYIAYLLLKDVLYSIQYRRAISYLDINIFSDNVVPIYNTVNGGDITQERLLEIFNKNRISGSANLNSVANYILKDLEEGNAHTVFMKSKSILKTIGCWLVFTDTYFVFDSQMLDRIREKISEINKIDPSRANIDFVRILVVYNIYTGSKEPIKIIGNTDDLSSLIRYRRYFEKSGSEKLWEKMKPQLEKLATEGRNYDWNAIYEFKPHLIIEITDPTKQ